MLILMVRRDRKLHPPLFSHFICDHANVCALLGVSNDNVNVWCRRPSVFLSGNAEPQSLQRTVITMILSSLSSVFCSYYKEQSVSFRVRVDMLSICCCFAGCFDRHSFVEVLLFLLSAHTIISLWLTFTLSTYGEEKRDSQIFALSASFLFAVWPLALSALAMPLSGCEH